MIYPYLKKFAEVKIQEIFVTAAKQHTQHRVVEKEQKQVGFWSVEMGKLWSEQSFYEREREGEKKTRLE